ncbi:MAG: winged helix DNA-binding protein [Clostridia bacterium]|nr:winged helix DNA-binding protein [Clostridia bacterium]
MDRYEMLACELMQALDQHKKGPPHEEVSQTMRGEMAVLRLLMTEGEPMTAGELSRTLSMTTSRIAAVLGTLEKKGMLVRMADEADRRRVLAVLTKKGKAFCQARRDHARRDITSLLTRLGEEDAVHFVRIMKRIHEIMPDGPSGCKTDKEECFDEQ